MRSIPSFAAAPFLVLLASCVAPADRAPAPAPRPAPGPRPAPAPVPQPAPPPASTEWHDRPVAPGTWTYRSEGAATAALYGVSPASPVLTVRCDIATRRVSFARAGVGQGNMILRTSFGAMSWPAAVTATQTVAVRAASDTGLDQISYSRGKFAVEISGLAPLILPAWAEVARVIEDCRG